VRHLLRALIACGITSLVFPTFFFFFDLTERILRGRALFDHIMIARFTDIAPKMILMSLLLLLYIAVPMVLLWLLPAARRWFSRSWIAAIAGTVCGMLLSYAWLASFQPVFSLGVPVTWHQYRRALPVLLPMTAIIGGLSTFIHAFLTNRAEAKGKWLASRKEEAVAGE